MTKRAGGVNPHFYPVILAGGRGTRFWPRSRKRSAKQVLALDGKRTMIQQTVERLLPLAPAKNFWIITNDDLRAVIARQLAKSERKQIIAEPVARNTAPAIGLAAFILAMRDPQAVIGLFPADHSIQDAAKLHKNLRQAIQIAASGDHIAVMGIKPTRAETGYGYIEAGDAWKKGVLRVKRFTEKPNAQRAEEFLAAGNYFWNSGMFVWRAQTLVNALREHLSETAPHLQQIAAAFGTSSFEGTFRKLYPKCENISIDYAVLEPRSAKGEHSSNVYCIPAEFSWNDLGSWDALYEHQLASSGNGTNVIESKEGYTLNAEGNYIYAPKKFVAAVGVRDLVVVETDDALLVTTRQHSQDVGKIVKHLDERKAHKLL